jgi:hypothetical protein
MVGGTHFLFMLRWNAGGESWLGGAIGRLKGFKRLLFRGKSNRGAWLQFGSYIKENLKMQKKRKKKGTLFTVWIRKVMPHRPLAKFPSRLGARPVLISRIETSAAMVRKLSSHCQ